jgi:hypothetical protein
MKTIKQLLVVFLLASSALAHTVTLKWNAPTTGPAPDHYKVYRSLTSGSGYVIMGTVPATSLGFVNGSNPNGTPLVEGQQYCYVVTSAVSGSPDSINSNEICVTVPVTTTTVQPPSNLTGVVQ